MSRIKPFIPTDPLFPLQWHLLNTGNTTGSVAGHDINVTTVWPDYTGKGVLVGVQDDGIESDHPDLVANFRADLAWDIALDQPGGEVKRSEDAHGVSVSGLIASTANNGIGGVGVAWGASFTMYRLDLDGLPPTELAAAFERGARRQIDDGVQISSNSWGPGVALNQDMLMRYHAVGRLMAEEGRDGLGIVTLFAGGNDREVGMNTNYDPTDNSPWVIVVAASHQNGQITSYSTPGASILITAPGSGSVADPPSSMVTTDRQGMEGYNKTPGAAGDYVGWFNGTSAATPVAAGVVALMLEANAGLGYRDVQEILAYSAKRASLLGTDADQAYNGSRDWNGGAMLASHDFGFGNIDAHAAVRLAESWTKTSTASNLVFDAGRVEQRSLNLGSNEEGTAVARFAPNHRVEHMAVTVDLEAEDMDDVTLQLISPDGMVSTLAAPGGDDDDDDDDAEDDDDDEGMPDALHTTFTTVLNWGATLTGDWTLKVIAGESAGNVQLKDWSILAFTAGEQGSGTQIFTDEFARFAQEQPGRTVMSAENGTTLNAAAVTSDVRFDLLTGVSSIGSTEISLLDTASFRHLVSGDGDDILIGNEAGNVLMAGRGHNIVDGGAGLDVARFIGESVHYTVDHVGGAMTVTSHTLAGGGTDILYNVELLRFEDQVVLTRVPVNVGADLFDEDAYLMQNPDVQAAVMNGQLQSGRQHYEIWGVKEGRNPNMLFDEQWYLSTHADVAQAVANGLLASGFQHYRLWGWQEGRDPSAWMDVSSYLDTYVDVAAAEINPLQHYLVYGIHEGRSITSVAPEFWAA